VLRHCWSDDRKGIRLRNNLAPEIPKSCLKDLRDTQPNLELLPETSPHKKAEIKQVSWRGVLYKSFSGCQKQRETITQFSTSISVVVIVVCLFLLKYYY